MKRSFLPACFVVAACFSEGDVDDDSAEHGESTHASSEGTTTTVGGVTGTSSSSEGESGSADTTTGAPGCGDLMIGPDEDCDDGNDVPGDGCSACRTTGTVLWSEHLGMNGLRDQCYAVLLGEQVIAAGDLAEAPDVYNGWVEAFERDDGTPAWRFDDDDDETSSGFRALAWIDPGEIVAVGMRNNIGLVAGDGWAKRFTAGGVSGIEQELTWHEDGNISGFVGVGRSDEDLLLAANVVVDASYHPWYGTLPLAEFPDPAFPTSSLGAPGIVLEGFRHDGNHVRGVERHFTAMPTPLALVGFDGMIVGAPASFDLPASDAPVALAVDGAGRSWVCGSTEPDVDVPREVQITVVAPGFDDTQSVTYPLEGDATCRAIAIVGDGAVLAAHIDASTTTVVEIGGDMTVVWTSPLDVGPATPRSIALDEAGDRLAICGMQPDTQMMDDAWVALVVR